MTFTYKMLSLAKLISQAKTHEQSAIQQYKTNDVWVHKQERVTEENIPTQTPQSMTFALRGT